MKVKFLALLTALVTLFSLTSVVSADTAPENPYSEYFVYHLYETVLDREPDQAGLDFWVDNLESGRFTAGEVVARFFFSEEYANFRKTPAEYVEDLYEAVLFRESDSIGYQNWYDMYFKTCYICIYSTDCGVLNGFILSKEFGNICDKMGLKRGDEMFISNQVITTLLGDPIPDLGDPIYIPF